MGLEVSRDEKAPAHTTGFRLRPHDWFLVQQFHPKRNKRGGDTKSTDRRHQILGAYRDSDRRELRPDDLAGDDFGTDARCCQTTGLVTTARPVIFTASTGD